MTISKELLDELLKGVERPEDLLGEAGLMKELKIKLMERMLGAELTAHLGYEEGKEAPPGQTNRRNGASTKVLKGQDGEMPVAVPRDRDSSFEPELVKKGQTRIDGMDDKIIGLYAAGLTVRDPVENQIRKIALTRKNALFAGHEVGAENWAMLASLIANCKMSDVDPVSYLADTLRALLDGHPKSRIDELMPWNFTTASSLAA